MTPLSWARALFGSSLGFHIIFATIGVGLPLLIALAEVRALRDPHYRTMARRWASVFAVFLGAGVVSGTIVAVQLSLLWPSFMRLVGQIIALPFAIEVFAFFIEAVFTAIYVLAGDRIRPGWRIFSSFAVAAGAAGSALLITDVNAFMNTPTGFRLHDGIMVDVNPWRAMLSASMPSEIAHVLVTAYMTVGFLMASFAAWGLSGPTSPPEGAYRKNELSLAMTVAGIASLLTAVTGDWSGRFLAAAQPVKFAAAEGLFKSGRDVPLTIGGWPDAVTGTVRGGLEIPGLLSWLATGDAHGRVRGLDAFPREVWPPLYVHLLFDLMVAIGGLALVASAVYWDFRRRRRELPRWTLRSLIAMGPLSVLGIEAGWVFAEIGRQPWTVTGLLLTRDAVTSSPYLGTAFFIFITLYLVLSIGAVLAVRSHLRSHPLNDALRMTRLEPTPRSGEVGPA